MSEIILQTGCGPVRGRQEQGYRIFRGIPYAITERFTMPRAVPAWTEVLDATGPETDCWQYSSFNDESRDDNPFYYQEFRPGRDFHYAESPMTLNITTPEHPLGVYHPHAELHHIKKENIGLIEVMGLAVLPSRLKA